MGRDETGRKVERTVERIGLLLGLAMFLTLLTAVGFAIGLGLDEGSWWRDGLGQWLLGLSGVALVLGAVYVVRRNW